MLSIRVDTRALAQVKNKFIASVNRSYRAKVYLMLEDALMRSAQFSGDYASNWRIVADTAELPAYRQWPGKVGLTLDGKAGNVHQMGDMEAVAYAREMAARVPFNYKQKVYLVNPTPLTFTATTVTGPDGDTKNLRPENIIPGSVTLKSYLYAKYKAS